MATIIEIPMFTGGIESLDARIVSLVTCIHEYYNRYNYAFSHIISIPVGAVTRDDISLVSSRICDLIAENNSLSIELCITLEQIGASIMRQDRCIGIEFDTAADYFGYLAGGPDSDATGRLKSSIKRAGYMIKDHTKLREIYDAIRLNIDCLRTSKEKLVSVYEPSCSLARLKMVMAV